MYNNYNSIITIINKQMDGYWHPVTSMIDWCESNYTHSYYIAEFWNTISNLAYILLGSYGIYKNKYAEKRFKIAFSSLILVGIGSALFHGTLKWFTQLCDEISMFIGSITVLYILIEHRNIKPKYHYLPHILTLVTVIFSWLYIQFRLVILFQTVWISITIIIFIMFYKLVKPFGTIKKRCYFNILIIFGISALCWLADYMLCYHLPIIQVVQLHSFAWHLGTAYVSYSIMNECLVLRYRYVKIVV